MEKFQVPTLAERVQKLTDAAKEQTVNKRLTDAELAAEYHSAWASMLEVPKDERYSYERPRIETLHRFATLPHYDEATL